MTEEEIITGILVTGGSSDDGKQLHELLQQTKHNQVQVTDKAKQGQNLLAMLLATIGQTFKLRLSEKQPPVGTEPLVTLRLKGGLLMRVEKR